MENHKRGILVVNLGTPGGPETKLVRKYLRQFLMDPYVIDLPWIFRAILVYGIIAPFRGPKSSHSYQRIWHAEHGSPLLYYSERFVDKLRSMVEVPVELSMRYGDPGIEEGLRNLYQQNVDTLSCFLMYPQYAESTTKTAVEIIQKSAYFKKFKSVCYNKDFYNWPGFIQPLVEEMSPHLINADHLLLSYHGLPKNHLTKLDRSGGCLDKQECCDQPMERISFCYKAQCYATSRAITSALPTPISVSTSFQSRLGDKWIGPYTDEVVKQLAEKGVKRLVVACPAFTVDCLETLEEIGMELKSQFLQLGGEGFQLVSCLNDRQQWVKNVAFAFKSEPDLWRNMGPLGNLV